MANKFKERVQALEPKHYVVIVLALLFFVGAIYGIVTYQQAQFVEENQESLEDSIAEDLAREEEAKEQATDTEIVAPATPKTATSTTDGYNELSQSGPENFYLPELIALSGSALVWYSARNRLRQKRLER